MATDRTGGRAAGLSRAAVAVLAEPAVEVIAAARRHGCTVLMDDTAGEPGAELRIACGLGDPMIDGVILSPLGLDQHELLSEADYGLICDHVHIDNVAAARVATEHLIGRGYRRVAAIGWQEPSPRATAQQRLLGYT